MTTTKINKWGQNSLKLLRELYLAVASALCSRTGSADTCHPLMLQQQLVGGPPCAKLIVSNLVSLDGYVEGPGRNFMVMPVDGFFDEYNLERQRTADTLLLGAATYTGLKSYWPAVAENPQASPTVTNTTPTWPTFTARPAYATTSSTKSSCPTR